MADEVQAPSADTEQAEPERPDWLPENFKDGPTLADAFRETKADNTRKSQRLAESERRIAELEQQQEQFIESLAAMDPRERQASGDDNAEYWAYKTGLEPEQLRSLTELFSQLVPQAQAGRQGQEETVPPQYIDTSLHTAELLMAQQHPDWPEVKQQVDDFLVQNPGLLPQGPRVTVDNLQKALTTAYDHVTGVEVKRRLSEVGTSREQLEEYLRSQKMRAQSLSGQGHARTPADELEAWKERMAAVSKSTYGHGG